MNDIELAVWVDKVEMEIALEMYDPVTTVAMRIRMPATKTRELISILEAACKQLDVPEHYCGCGKVEEPCPGPDGKLGCER